MSAAILSFAFLCYPITALTVRVSGQGSLLCALPASEGGAFRFAWVHSVSRRQVSETYLIRSNTHFCLEEMIFDHEGPGMPSYPEGETTWRIEDGKVVVKGYSSCLDRLELGVSPFGHRLQVGGWDKDLVSLIGSESTVSVRIEKIPLILLLGIEGSQWQNLTS